MKRHEGGGLPLATFAQAKTSGYDKRERLDRQRKQHMNKAGKYKKLLHRMEAQGKPLPALTTVKDNVADLEQLFFTGDEPKATAQQGSKQSSKKRRREEAGDEEAGPNHGQQTPTDHQAPADKKHKRQQGQQQVQQAPQPAPAAASTKQHHSQPGTGQHREQQTGSAPDGGKHSKHAGKPDKGKPAGKYIKPGQKPSRLHRLLSEQEQRQAEADNAKKQAQEARAQRQAQIEAVQKQRKKDKQHFFKRTRTGQPLMRYRMEKILAELQKE